MSVRKAAGFLTTDNRFFHTEEAAIDAEARTLIEEYVKRTMTSVLELQQPNVHPQSIGPILNGIVEVIHRDRKSLLNLLDGRNLKVAEDHIAVERKIKPANEQGTAPGGK